MMRNITIEDTLIDDVNQRRVYVFSEVGMKLSLREYREETRPTSRHKWRSAKHIQAWVERDRKELNKLNIPHTMKIRVLDKYFKLLNENMEVGR